MKKKSSLNFFFKCLFRSSHEPPQQERRPQRGARRRQLCQQGRLCGARAGQAFGTQDPFSSGGGGYEGSLCEWLGFSSGGGGYEGSLCDSLNKILGKILVWDHMILN